MSGPGDMARRAMGAAKGGAVRLVSMPWIGRQLYFMDYALGTMKRRLGRNLALLGVYLLIVFMLASVMMFTSSIRHEASLILQYSPELLVQRLRMGRHEMIAARHVKTLSRIRGVQKARGRLWGYFFDGASGANFTLMVPEKNSAYSLKKGETIIGEGVARVKKLKKGSYLFMLSSSSRLMKLRVKKIISPASALVSSDLVLLSAQDFRKFFSLPQNVYTDIALSIRNSREIDKIVEKAARKLPFARFITRRDIMRTYESIFSWREGLLLALLAASIIAFAILAFDRASGLSGEEKREIGILKAIGWESGDILAMKMWEGALVSLFAFVFGVLAAWVHVFLFSAGLLEPVLKGWAVLYPQFTLKPAISTLELASLAFFTVLPFTAATLVPVWRAAVTDPDEVMR